MDALGTQIASASLHNSVSETPPFWAGKKIRSLIIGHPFPPPQLYKDDRYIYIETWTLCLILNTALIILHELPFLTLTKNLWSKNYFHILEIKELRKREVTTGQKGRPSCHQSSIPMGYGRESYLPDLKVPSSPALCCLLTCWGTDILSKTGSLLIRGVAIPSELWFSLLSDSLTRSSDLSLLHSKTKIISPPQSSCDYFLALLPFK